MAPVPASPGLAAIIPQGLLAAQTLYPMIRKRANRQRQLGANHSKLPGPAACCSDFPFPPAQILLSPSHRSPSQMPQMWLVTPSHPLFVVSALLAFICWPSASGFQYGRCFQKLERHSIDNSQPLTEIFRTSPHACLEQCIAHTGNGEEENEAGPLCRAVVYDHLQHGCRLFGHDGRKVPAVLHPANGFDLYRRTASSQECAGPVQRLLALQQSKKGGGLLAAPSQTNADGKEPIPLLKPSAEAGDSELGDQELAALLDQLEPRKGGGLGLQSDPLANGADQADQSASINCAGRTTGFLVFSGGQRDEEDAEEFLGWNRRQCADFCAENEGPDGERSACAGFSHSPGGGKCRLHRRLAQGELSLQSIGGGVYAEKWCIPDHRFGLCRESSQFQIHLQQRFHPQCVPLTIFEGVQTLVDCMHRCLNQIGCQSVSFHAPSLRCHLHREAPTAVLVESADQGWTLAENDCQERKGPVGLVDSEDGQMGNEDKQDGADGASRAFGLANQQADCADGRLSELLLGRLRRK